MSHQDPEVMAGPVFSSGRCSARLPCGSVISRKLVSIGCTAEAQFPVVPAVPVLTSPGSPGSAGPFRSRCPRAWPCRLRALCSRGDPCRPQRVRPCSCDCPPRVKPFHVKASRVPCPLWPGSISACLSHAPLCSSEHLCRGTVPAVAPPVFPGRAQHETRVGTGTRLPRRKEPSLTSKSLSRVPQEPGTHSLGLLPPLQGAPCGQTS